MKNSDQSENNAHITLNAVLKRNIRQLINQKDWVQAYQLLQQLKEQDSFSKETQGLEYEYLIKSSQFQDAQSLSTRLLDWYPDSSRIYFLTGLLYYNQKQYEKALPNFQESQNLYFAISTQRYIGKTLTQIGRFAEAEASLQSCLSHQFWILKDLAWLYERQLQYPRAIDAMNRYLEHDPDNRYVKAQLQRLKTKQLSHEEIQEEIESLSELDEIIPTHLMVEHFQALIQQGKIQLARQWVRQHVEQWDARTSLDIAWISYRFNLYDIAFQFFIQNFEQQQHKFKFLNALESTSKKIAKQLELAKVYDNFAPNNEKLYGRKKTLLKSIKLET